MRSEGTPHSSGAGGWSDEIRRSFRTRGLIAWHTQSVALGWYALPRWGKRTVALIPPPPSGMGIQGCTLRWYAVFLWDISSPQRGGCIPARGATPGTDGTKPMRSERTPHREGNVVMRWPPGMGKAAASGRVCGAGVRRAFASRRRSGRRAMKGTRRCGAVRRASAKLTPGR